MILVVSYQMKIMLALIFITADSLNFDFQFFVVTCIV